MCYAIPGKVIDIDRDIVTIEYFGEKRKAKNEFFKLTDGDYVYAQGGFVVQKIPTKEALPILEAWRELFFKLKEIDQKLTQNPKNLYEKANNLRQKYHGNSCCIHGIMEFSNYCCNDCLYCGLRHSNAQLKRYRMDTEEIVKACEYAIKELNFKALVLQSGEDYRYDEKRLVDVVRRIMESFPVLLILSIGERDIEIYKKLYKAGARGILIRFETSNQRLYEEYRRGKKLLNRINLIKELRKIGYLVFTGFLIGLPQQTEEDILKDIELAYSLEPEMFSFGPFIPHPNTPLKDAPVPSVDLVLTTIAKTRLMYPESRILVTTALETLDKENGARLGLLS
ncbi:MAG: [FeFe] hydrogenase H-cluster radical SAM maturase HydE, partial [Candidatus Omnitrophica bacterium]|nr:[FeFe] hydrogenase H-cluster radical SAM maturase HydE [Candidatus Omnitrophota bacterium]